LHILSRPRRPLRYGEWTPAKAVTFIVTLAATRSVTLAANESGMSRKSAYALKSRDPAFAAAWMAAMNAAKNPRREGAWSLSRGDKVKEVEDPPVQPRHGNMSPLRVDRERTFAMLLARLRESPPLAPCPPAQ
jgi:hypothetical protein